MKSFFWLNKIQITPNSSHLTLLERDGAAVAVREFVTLDELRAAVRLRVRTFYEYAVDSVGTEVIDPFSSVGLDREAVLGSMIS